VSALHGTQHPIGSGQRGLSQQVEQDAEKAPPPSVASAADEAHVLSVVRGAGSSFYGAMRTLPKERRDAMFAIYAFCREIDDIADDPMPPDERAAALADWRLEIDRLYEGHPRKPTARALLGPVARYALQKKDFVALIDGMEMDASEIFDGPSMATLTLYCERVAGAVGMLSVRVFGEPGDAGTQLAWSLGQALQLTNILRDLKEDAERGRLYLPDELLARHGIAAREPMAVLAHPALPGVCDDLAALARQRFDEAIAAMHRCDRRKIRPAVVMMHVYRRVLELLIRRGWRRLDAPAKLSKAAKIWIALRYGLF
jgi:presqualene diphosphate synthase